MDKNKFFKQYNLKAGFVIGEYPYEDNLLLNEKHSNEKQLYLDAYDANLFGFDFWHCNKKYIQRMMNDLIKHSNFQQLIKDYPKMQIYIDDKDVTNELKTIMQNPVVKKQDKYDHPQLMQNLTNVAKSLGLQLVKHERTELQDKLVVKSNADAFEEYTFEVINYLKKPDAALNISSNNHQISWHLEDGTENEMSFVINALQTVKRCKHVNKKY